MPHAKMIRRACALPLFALASCVAPPKAVTPPAPPPPVIAPQAPALSADWQDWPLSPGGWTYRDGAAAFAAADGRATFALRCDLASRTVVLAQPVPAAEGPAAMTITTSDGVRTLAGTAGAAGTQASLAARDPFLDRMAFSRGRILVAIGAARLVLPAWAEIGRVVEDCRA